MSWVTRAIGATKLAVKANGPSIMVGTGIIAMGASVVTASKQTLKLEEVLAPHVETLDKVDAAWPKVEGYTAEDKVKDKGIVHGRIIKDVVVLYWVPGVLFVGGAALVFGGHRILLKRNAALALAYTGLKKTFDAYRARVTNTFGGEADQAMMSGFISSKTNKDGTPVDPHRDWDNARVDPYNRVFEEYTSTMWENDLGLNKMFISTQQRYAQQLLNRRGYLYLNEVYKSLGMEQTDVGQVVGWKITRDPDTQEKHYPFVDFGLDTPHAEDWSYTENNAIYLDFNCSGLIVGGKIQKLLEQA